MGNAQQRPPGRGDGGGQRTQPCNPGQGRGCGKAPIINGTHGNNRTHTGEESTVSSPAETEGDSSYLDAPAGALPPPLARLKNEGNKLFKNGQFGDALEKYSQAITGCEDAGIDSPEDLCILHSNRAACYLKDGNSTDCITDCTRALELQPFSLKPLLRRALAHEYMERYRKAYVDYKTVLQIDVSVQAAHDSINRITKVLIEQDGPKWREQLPEIPLVPLSAQQHRREEPPSQEMLQARADRKAEGEARKAEVRFSSLKKEGNDLVRQGCFQDALGKYNECLQIKPNECAVYTNRALCYLRGGRFQEAKQDCDSALEIEPANKKAFYRRALAFKGLKDYLSASTDLQEVLQLDPNVQEAEQELEEMTLLLRQSLMSNATQG